MSYFLKHLQNLKEAGWQCDHVSSYRENPMPMASFYMFYPASDDVIHASMPLDDFMDLIGNHMRKLPHNLLQPNILCNEVIRYGNNYHNVDYRSLLPGILGLYMASTKTGQRYFANAAGRPFHFIVIMYPADRTGNEFNVRPFLTMEASDVLSAVLLKKRSETVMAVDKQAGKPFFNFLKKEKSFSKVG